MRDSSCKKRLNFALENNLNRFDSLCVGHRFLFFYETSMIFLQTTNIYEQTTHRY